jgi:hypothetical protein
MPFCQSFSSAITLTHFLFHSVGTETRMILTLDSSALLSISNITSLIAAISSSFLFHLLLPQVLPFCQFSQWAHGHKWNTIDSPGENPFPSHSLSVLFK